jgi:hypothetical protein
MSRRSARSRLRSLRQLLSEHFGFDAVAQPFHNLVGNTMSAKIFNRPEKIIRR